MFQGERIEKGQGTWDPSEEPPRDVTSLSWLRFSFLFVPERFYKRNERRKKKKKTSMQALQLLLLLQCYWFNYYYMYNSFFSHIFSFHWLDLVREWQLLRDYKLKGSGWGVQHICFMAFFALFHGLLCLFWIWRAERRTCLRRSVKHKDLERRKLRLLQKISEDRETTQKHSGLKLFFIRF